MDSQIMRCWKRSLTTGASKYLKSPGPYVAPRRCDRDVIIIGGGHNGLVASAYLAEGGQDVVVLERRHCIGGAAVTEEIVPGFKFSRASYLAGLLRPQVISDLNLEKYGFKYLPRDPSSFTPTKIDSAYGGKYLLLGSDEVANWNSIAQFSKKDADSYPKYEDFLGQIRDIVQPLLDGAPPDLFTGQLNERLFSLKTAGTLLREAANNKEILAYFYELLTGPAEHILNRWFESDILKTTLATDAVVGALVSPKHNGSAYVLLHHVMGEAAGKKGVWSYVQGGMGAISEAIAASARDKGAEIIKNATVKEIIIDNTPSGNRAVGVMMEDGSKIYAKHVISGCTPYHTFMELLPQPPPSSSSLHSNNSESDSTLFTDEYNSFHKHIQNSDYSCGSLKINCAVNKLPNFTCYPSPANGQPGPMHTGTIHFESQMIEIEQAYKDAALGRPAQRPVIEMTIPSALDKTISPVGSHVVQLFVQFAPYDIDPSVGSWADPVFKNAFADKCFAIIEEYCPGFSSSVIGRDIVTPLDLEHIFGLHKGSISHGSLGLHQLGYARPAPGYATHRSPVPGLYMCSAGCHPGGGVMGAAGRNCARVILSDLGKALT